MLLTGLLGLVSRLRREDRHKVSKFYDIRFGNRPQVPCPPEAVSRWQAGGRHPKSEKFYCLTSVNEGNFLDNVIVHGHEAMWVEP